MYVTISCKNEAEPISFFFFLSDLHLDECIFGFDALVEINILKVENIPVYWFAEEYTHYSFPTFYLMIPFIRILGFNQSYVSDTHSGVSMKPHEDVLIRCSVSDVLFNQLLTWENKREHCFSALMLYYPTKLFTIVQPSHLIKVINLQQLAQKDQ